MRLGIAIGVALVSAVAFAQPRDKQGAQSVYAQGQAAYKAGDYRAAADKFQLAYDKDPDPVYLFNLGQAQRFAKQCRAAADSYKRFLAEAPTAPNKDQVTRLIDDMDACARTQPLLEPPPAPIKESEPAPAQPPAATSVPAPASAVAVEVPPPEHGHRHSPLAYALGGVGVVAIGAGVYFTVDVLDVKSQQEQCAVPRSCDGTKLRSLDRQGGRDNVGQVVTYTVGVAALGTGLWLYFHHSGSERTIAAAPTSGGAVVTAGFSF